MALSTRELYLALRVRDEGTRNLTRFADAITRTGIAGRVASLKAKADMIREEAALKRNELASERVRLARLRANDASAAQIRGLSAVIAERQKEINAMERQAQVYDRMATKLQREAAQRNQLNTIYTQTGVALETIGVAFSFAGVAGLGLARELTSSAMEYQRQVAMTLTQVDNFAESLGNLSDIGKRVAKNVAVPFETIQPALFDIFSSMEVNTKDAETLLTKFAQAAVAGQVNIQDASRATIGIMNAFSIPVSKVDHLLDAQFQLVKEGIGTYAEWTDRIGQVSPSAVRAGQSVDMMLAALAATTRFGIPAAQSATSVARAWDAFSNPTAVKRLKELGVHATDAAGNFRPFNQVMREFKAVLDKMPGGQEKKTEAILEVFKGAGSTIQARKFLQTILLSADGLNTLDNILGRVQTTTGSFEQAYDIMADTTAMKSQIISNKWNVMKETLGEHLLPYLEKLFRGLEKIFQWFDKLSPAQQDAIAKFILFGSILSIFFGIILVGLGFLAVFISSMTAVGATLLPIVAIVSSVILVLVGFIATIVVLWNKSEGFRGIIKGLWENFKELGRIVLSIAKGIADAWEKYVAPKLAEVWQLIEEKVLPAFNKFREEVWDRLAPKLAEAGRIIGSAFGMAFKAIGWLIDNIVIPGIKKLNEWWDKNREKLEPLINFLSQWGKVILIIVGVAIAAFIVALVALAIVIGVIVVAAVTLAVAIFGGLAWVISKVWEFLKFIGPKIKDVFVTLWGDIKLAWNHVVDFVTKDIPAFFSRTKDDFTRFAGNILQGFIDGLKSKFNDILSVIKSISGGIIDTFKTILGIGSPSKEMAKVGVFAAQGYIEGFQRTMSNAVLQGIGQDAYLGMRPAAMAVGGAPRVGGVENPRTALTPTNAGEKHITNNITVYTQELDAREQSAKLGWELAGRL